ncbi:phosphoribosylamine--glycine ligase [Desulfatibacillum aliphaticivorans]|uniref:phosphoribosylamine--glycine ligase n=1 Tax=Desulfatibacillum aliphaticivorans TaxID=218208 RepID=UPI0004157202|nr:phosphoribosylamine--glycine ligase [Desulfatibacillum aliphaticivorans]
MKVLVIGSGGREHALVWKLSQSPKVEKIYCAPGNAGIAESAECVPISAEDIPNLLAFAKENAIGLTVVGPEAPLTEGIVDKFEKAGLMVFGASKAAARLEGSKSFAKSLMTKYGIPTAIGKTFTDIEKAKAYIEEVGGKVVVKADGLAAGKGVMVCTNRKQALEAVNLVMEEKAFGDAGKKMVIEELLVGEEASFLAFTDGKTVLPLPSSQDHKAIYDGDKGPNTGGMGAYSPAPVVDAYMHDKIMNEVMKPTVKAMAAEGAPYKGVLYAGLMIDGDDIKVLEFNARFGDPECQPLLMRLKTDLVEIMEAVSKEELDKVNLEIDPRATVCIVLASKGYPGSYDKGMPISGLDAVKRMKDVFVFHAGTALQDEKIVASGGRVLGVTALGETIDKAIDKAYKAADKIKWTGVYKRKDIGQKASRHAKPAPLVSILMGSDSDLKVMQGATEMLTKLRIPYEMTVASAHRTPERAAEIARTARDRGIKVIIAGAGAAAHLAGALAAQTTLPVIGVPIDATPLAGFDALLATVQMPPGIPVATVAVGKMGAKNAGVLAAQIIGVGDETVAKRLAAFKEKMAEEVIAKAKKVEAL